MNKPLRAACLPESPADDAGRVGDVFPERIFLSAGKSIAG